MKEPWPNLLIYSQDNTVAIGNKKMVWGLAKRSHLSNEDVEGHPVAEANGWEIHSFFNGIALVDLGGGIWAAVAPTIGEATL